MKVLLVGVGTVGEAIARLSACEPWLEKLVLADHDLARARRIAEEIGDDSSHPTAVIDASDQRAVEELARAHDVDLVLNAVDADYMDLAVSTSEPDPSTLGDYVTGLKDGAPREIFSYQMCDAQDIMARFGLQRVGWQTGFGAAGGDVGVVLEFAEAQSCARK